MTRIILQARTDSTRLPAKSLLPVGGLPLAVLCAKRLGNAGIDITLATSTASSDDELATQARDHGVAVFRGDLANVAHRFLTCLANAPDDEIVVRATADNPVPDGAVVAAFLDDFAAADAAYLGPAAYNGIGHGLGVEVIRLSALRRAYETQRNSALEEHVTSTFASAPTPAVRDPRRFALAAEAPRLTVDLLSDYVVTAHAFRSVAVPIIAGWREVAGAIIARRTVLKVANDEQAL